MRGSRVEELSETGEAGRNNGQEKEGQTTKKNREEDGKGGRMEKRTEWEQRKN